MTKAILSFLLFCGSLLCHPAIAAGWPQPSGSAFAEEASLQNKPEMSATPNPEQGLPTKTTENDGILDAERLSRARQAETFRPSALILPGAVFTAGAVGVNWDLYARNINLPLKDYAGDLRSKYGKIGADDWVQYAPIISYVVAGAFGAKTQGVVNLPVPDESQHLRNVLGRPAKIIELLNLLDIDVGGQSTMLLTSLT